MMNHQYSEGVKVTCVLDKRLRNKNDKKGCDKGIALKNRKNSLPDPEKVKVILEFPSKADEKNDSVNTDLQEAKKMLSNMLEKYLRAIS